MVKLILTDFKPLEDPPTQNDAASITAADANDEVPPATVRWLKETSEEVPVNHRIIDQQ